MAEIRSFPWVRHLRADASSHVLLFKRGALRESRRGLATWFTPLSTSIAEVPVDQREQTFVFHGRSADYQDVSAQVVVTFQATDPKALAERIDFTIDLRRGAHLHAPLDKIAGLMVQRAGAHAWDYVATTEVRTVLAEGPVQLRQRIEAGLRGDPTLSAMGLTVLGVGVEAVRPTPEVGRALEAPVRERIQQEADEATFGRRAMAVEKERAIQENELQNKIELAKRGELLIAQEGINARHQATEEAEARRIAAAGEAARAQLQGEAEAARLRLHGGAEGDSVRAVDGARVAVERERLEAYRDLSPQVLLALAAHQLAGKLEVAAIDHLSITPDLLGSLLAQLAGTAQKRLAAPERGVSPNPRVVVVTRPSEYEALTARHGTREQARFFLESHGRSLAEVEERHGRMVTALERLAQAVPAPWRRARVRRDELAQFLFGPDDVVVALGQDGLVANVAKYLSGQPVIGLNPDPGWYDGVLVRHPPEAAGALMRAAAARACALEARTMVQAVLDDGQRLLALNELFLGHVTHQSARYLLRAGGQEERQSSSGVIVATGTGATGWARSINGQRREPLALPSPADRAVVFMVREPFPSRVTGTALEGGVLEAGEELRLASEMNEGGTLFGDGLEQDRVDLPWGMNVRVGVAGECLQLVVGA